MLQAYSEPLLWDKERRKGLGKDTLGFAGDQGRTNRFLCEKLD
jgi:hypothetical protein